MRSKVLICCVFLFVFFGCIEQPPKKTNNLHRELVKASGGKFYGKILKYKEPEYFRSLDPHSTVTIVGSRVSNQIYEGLVKLNHETLSIEPGIAKSWNVDSTGTIYTFHLRPGVYFHSNPCFKGTEGREVTSKDFKYCLTRLCTYREDNNLYYSVEGLIKGASEYFKGTKQGLWPSNIPGIKCIDRYTIQITLNYPSNQFLYSMGFLAGYVFPKEAVDYYEKGFGKSPVGTGPFILSRIENEKLLTLKRNQNYWGKDSFGNSLPYLNGIHITFEESKLDEIMAFRGGELDILYSIPVKYINQLIGNIEAAKKGKNNPFRIQTTPQLGTEYLGFNHISPPFNNELVRQAFSHAIDKEKLTFYYLKGDGIAANNGFIPPCLPLYPFNNVKSPSYDSEKARTLLTKAGYPNGEGFPELLFYSSNDEKSDNIAMALKKMLKENLNVDIKYIPLPTFSEVLEKIENGESKMWRLSWFSDYPTAQNYLTQFYSGMSKSSNNVKDYRKTNNCKLFNPQLDSIFLIGKTETDVNKKMELFSKIDQILVDNGSIIPLYYREAIRLVAPTVENFPINPMEMRDFTEVYFRPENVKDLLVISNN